MMNPVKYEDIPLKDPKPDKCCCCFPNLLKLFNVKPETPPERLTVKEFYQEKTFMWVKEVIHEKETK